MFWVFTIFSWESDYLEPLCGDGEGAEGVDGEQGVVQGVQDWPDGDQGVYLLRRSVRERIV